MPNLTLLFSKAGLLTTVQDEGRKGYQAFGVPIGGSMDQVSAAQANELVGNTPNTPLLEMTMIGPQIHFSSACQIAITGADMSPSLDGKSIQNYETINIPATGVVSFGKLQHGCRAYLAVRGKWQIEPWLGSCGAMPFGAEKATPKSWIQKNSILEITPLPPIAVKSLTPLQKPKETASPLRIPVLAGPEWAWFSSRQIAYFFSQIYSISNDSNRMGYRLYPNIPNIEALPTLISSGIVPGTIQVTPNGSIIILMADAQTTGGYPRMGNLPQQAVYQLAQAKPGDRICFEFQD